MIKVEYAPEREAIKVEINFHCKQQYLAEVTALFHAITGDITNKELFMIAVSEKLNELKKELEEEQKDDKNNTCN